MVVQAAPGVAQFRPGRVLGSNTGLRSFLGGAVAGAVAPALTYTPTIRFHPNTATMSIRADGTCQGYLTTAGNFVVTTFDTTGATCSGINEGTTIKHVSLPGGQVKIVGLGQISGPPSGNGGLGSYLADITGTVIGSSGSPVTFTVVSEQVTAINDMMGNCDGLQSSDGSGAFPITDALGRKALLFRGNYAKLQSWLRNSTYTGIDTHNVAFAIVGRVLSPCVNGTLTPGQNPILWLGYPGSGAGTSATDDLGAMIVRGGVGNQLGGANGIYSLTRTTDNNIRKKFLLGNQMQVFGDARATSDGYNGTTTTYTSRMALNETANTYVRSQTRTKNFTGFTVGANALSSGLVPSVNSSNASATTTMIIYDIVAYTRGELGTNAQMPARWDQIILDLMTGWAIPAATKSLTLLGDSRVEETSNHYFPDHGDTLASVMTDPGTAYALPANVRVQNWGKGGEGIGWANMIVEQQPATNNFGYFTPLSPGFEFGGGNDYFYFLSGSNDIKDDGVRWPNVAGASTTTAFVDDLYTGNNGNGYTGTYNATASINTNSVTIASPAGYLLNGSMPTSGAPWTSYLGFQKLTPGPSTAATSATLSTYTTVAIPAATPTTVRADGYLTFVKKLLARGDKGVWQAETILTDPITSGAGYFSKKVLNNAVTDSGAGTGGAYQGNLSVFDSAPIQVGGKYVFAADSVKYGKYMADFIHFTRFGKVAMVSGGDNLANGLSAKIKAQMGVS